MGVNIPVLAALAVTLVGGGVVTGCQVERSRWEGKQRQAEHTIDSLAVVTAKQDTIFVRDTVTLTQWRARWQTIRDTVVLSDTVLVPGPVVREIVRVGDSTVAACTRVLRDCESLRGVLTAQRDSLVTVLARTKRPARLGCTVGVTYSITDITDHRPFTDWGNRVGITCGWRVVR